jgi:signal peptidase II
MARPAPVAPAAGASKGRARPGLLVGIVLAVLALDQLTKDWALGALDDGRTIDLVGSLRFRLVFNPGGAFSLFGGGGWGPVISALAITVVALLLWQLRSVASTWATVALGLVVGGALGNLVDRAVRGDDGFLHGKVVDFIDLQWWPVFNVADIGVVVGSFALVAVGVFGPVDEEPEPAPDGDPTVPGEPTAPEPAAEEPTVGGPETDETPGDGPGPDEGGPDGR